MSLLSTLRHAQFSRPRATALIPAQVTGNSVLTAGSGMAVTNQGTTKQLGVLRLNIDVVRAASAVLTADTPITLGTLPASLARSSAIPAGCRARAVNNGSGNFAASGQIAVSSGGVVTFTPDLSVASAAFKFEIRGLAIVLADAIT